MSDKESRYDPELPAFLDDAMADAMSPVELSSATRNALRERILERARATPPAGTRTIRSHEGHWRQIMPRVHQKILRKDRSEGTQTVLYRLEPGGGFPAHFHSHEEECWVLEGELETEGHVIRAGDMHIAAAGCEHPEISTRTGAVILIRSQIEHLPLR
jgi:quercetin dioxygenase-like cupin family protein